MDSFEIVKITGAVLCPLIVIVSMRTALDVAQEARAPQPAGYTLPMPKEAGASDIPAGGAAAVPAPVDLPAEPAPAKQPAEPAPVEQPAEPAPGKQSAVPPPGNQPAGPPPFNPAEVAAAAASADAGAGATIFKKCTACHRGEKGAPNKVGPGLWGVVGRPKASNERFQYSEPMKAKGGDWTLQDLASFIHNPRKFVPGTKMFFPGVSDSNDLANLLAYLNTLK